MLKKLRSRKPIYGRFNFRTLAYYAETLQKSLPSISRKKRFHLFRGVLDVRSLNLNQQGSPLGVTKTLSIEVGS